jgi:endonuclease/exonuclease/phosphatase family metal-dependent hydrolase
MSTTFRIATFNVENLFSRAKVLNRDDPTVGDDALKKIGELQKELRRSTYDKPKILSLYNQVKKYVSVSEDRGKLWRRSGYRIVGVKANGKSDWDGSLVFKKAKFSEMARLNTKKVITKVNADMLCLVEAEDKPTLRSFDSQLLNSRYKYEMLIDAMDPRGIDVGLYSKRSIGGVWTHMYDKIGNSRIFSRDCLEVEVLLDDDTPLYILCNHFKSKGYGSTPVSNAKRKRQAERVAEILNSDYDLNNDLVVVAGDLNDTADSDPLSPLMGVAGLKDVLEIQFPSQPAQRWTYHYTSNEQIDFMLVSKPLQDAFMEAGVERRGIYDLSTFSGGTEHSFDTVTSKANQASDHGAVWADFDL